MVPLYFAVLSPLLGALLSQHSAEALGKVYSPKVRFIKYSISVIVARRIIADEFSDGHNLPFYYGMLVIVCQADNNNNPVCQKGNTFEMIF